MKQDRRLAAIMFTDIVGSTDMMQHDETLAVNSVSKHKKVVEEMVTKHHGEVMNFYGDGSMSIFNSATAVLECAMEIQNQMHQPLRVPLRVGIHIGEILIQDGEVFGDGVNVASRIESLGQAGTVLFSEEIYRKIRNNKQFETALVGDFEFKNVQEPMAVYAISNTGFPVPKKETVTGKLKAQITDNKSSNSQGFGLKRMLRMFGISRSGKEVFAEENKNSIAVLPFEKIGDLGEKEVIANGLADDIRSRLLGIKNLKVISRSSSMHYVGKNVALKTLGKDLGVSYILEGRIHAKGDHAQIQAELSYAPTDKLIWTMQGLQLTEENLIVLQNQIANKVVAEMNLLLNDEEKLRLNTIPTSNSEAYMRFQMGRELLHRGFGSKHELESAADCFKKATELDPGFSQAWIGLADTYLEFIFWGRSSAKTMIEKAMTPCLKALELAPESGEAWGGMGSIYYYKGDKSTSRKYLLKAVDLSPGYVEAYIKLGWISTGENNLEEALAYFSKAHSLDPLSTKFLGDMGHAYYFEKRYDEGIEFIQASLQEHTDDSWLQWVYGLLLTGKKDYLRAIEILQKRKTGSNNWLLGYALAKAGEFDKAHEILEFNLQKRADDFVPAYMLATIYIGLGDNANALDWLAIDIEEGGLSHNFWNWSQDPIFEDLKGEPKYFELIKKIERP